MERDELGALLLQGSFDEIVRFLIPRVDSTEGLDAELVAAVADEALAGGVGKAVLALPLGLRLRVLPIVARDPRPAVRRALFREWAPESLEVPREGSALLPPDQWHELLRGALCDSDGEVRRAGAALAFDSGSAGALAAELLSAAGGERGLAWRALLALGQARDATSLERLVSVATSGDGALAAVAVRALAARRDGHRAFCDAFLDARAEVRSAALFALERVVERLDPERLAAVERAAGAREPRDVVVGALHAYRVRNRDAP